MSLLKYGKPMVPPSKNKVDKDKTKEDKDRVYPDDLDMVIAFTKDAEKWIESDYGNAPFNVYIDGLSLMFENIMEVFATDTFNTLFSMLFVWGFITWHT
jgi:hypothetical protein